MGYERWNFYAGIVYAKENKRIRGSDNVVETLQGLLWLDLSFVFIIVILMKLLSLTFS